MASSALVDNAVWAREETYWESLNSADMETYASLWHDAAIGWPNNVPAPMNKEAILKLIGAVVAGLEVGSGKITLTRQAIQVIGDVAIVHSEASGHARTKTGHDFSFKERIVHTWLRYQEEWKLLGGMAAPVPASRPEPL